GGESIADLIERVDGWLASLTDDTLRTVAVTHPAVIRAAILLALDAPPKSFWRIDIAPLSQIAIHFRGGPWTLRLYRGSAALSAPRPAWRAATSSRSRSDHDHGASSTES